MKKLILFLLIVASMFILSSCMNEHKDNQTNDTTQGGNQDGDQDGNQDEDKESVIQKILDEAASLADQQTLDGSRTATGTVKEIKEAYTEQYKNITFILTDGTADILVYRAKGDCASSLKVGDEVTVTGQVINYKGTIEFNTGSKLTIGIQEDNRSFVEKLTDEEKTPVIPQEVEGTYELISLPMAIAIAKDGGENFTSTTKYYITGWVSSVNNYSYGSITITDGNVSVYAYGISNYLDEEEWPLLGDVVVLEAVIGTHDGDVELKNATKIVEWHKVEVDTTKYEEVSLLEARNSEAGKKLIIEGTVASFTYKNAKTKNGEYVRDGLYLVNGTNSIFLYGSSIASAVEVGNTIKVAGIKEFFVQENEINLAQKFNFPGACQLSDVRLISNDKENISINEINFEETTIKTLMEKEFDDNITTQIYKVNALVKKSVAQDYVNYYINDLDETTGTYTYTKCNGNDFSWIDESLDENGQYLCTMLVTVCNAKATAAGCNWRLIPIAFLSDYTFDTQNTADFVFDYYVLPQFESTYYANPAKELITTHSSQLLGFENVTIEYSSSNESVANIKTDNGKTILNVNALGNAEITITISYDGNIISEVIEIIREGEPTFDSISIKEAIDANVNDTIIVEGIVGPSVVNQPTAFYLIDETGVIAVRMTVADELAKLQQGNKVVITGKRDQVRKKDTALGQTAIVDAVLLHNYFGEHEYSTETFVESTLAEVAQLQLTEDWTSQVFIVEATASISGYVAIISNGDASITLYTGNSSQYQWLVDAVAGKTLKMEVALCDWNSKTPYKACVLAVYLEDGTKIVNSFNFNK